MKKNIKENTSPGSSLCPGGWRRLLTICSVLSLLLIQVLPVSVHAKAETVLKAATYNIASMTAMTANGIGSTLAREGIEVIGLQEVQKYNNGSDPLLSLAKGRFSHSYFVRTSVNNRGASGQAILSTLPFLEEGTEEFEIDGENHQRFLRTVIEKDGKQVAFYSTHLTWKSKKLRLAQIAQLQEAVANDPVPYKVIVGDFNVESRAELIPMFEGLQAARDAEGGLLETFWDAEPYPSMDFYAIDHLFVSRNIRVENTRLLGDTASDHYCLAADLVLLDEPVYSTEWAEEALREAETLAKATDDYTSDSLNTLQEQLEQLQNMMEADEQPTQKQLDQKTRQLQNALISLVRENPWRKVDGRYRYRVNGDWLKDAWLEEDGVRYHFDEEGYMQTGLYQEADVWYYFRSDGSMVTDHWISCDGKRYRADVDGRLMTDWQWVEGQWYFFRQDASAYTGWLEQAGVTYYFRPDGSMAVGSERIDGALCLFDAEGALISTITDTTPVIDRPEAQGHKVQVETGITPSGSNTSTDIEETPFQTYLNAGSPSSALQS